jgi:hypothetical protein
VRRPGRLSVSVAADSAPGAGGRGRRLSCTVALAVAGALAAVTVGSPFLFDLLPGRGGDASHDDGAYASPSARPPGSGDASRPGTVPARYLGTWEGQGSGLGGALPLGTFRVTVHQAAVGGELGEVRHTDPLGGSCTDVLTLKQVGKNEIVASAAGAADNHAGCDQKPHTVHLAPKGDDLVYTSGSAASGNPVARLTRTT